VVSSLGPRRFLLAFDASSVGGGLVQGKKLKALSVVPLSQGALKPSAQEGNLPRPNEVVEAVKSVAATLRASSFAARVLLPAGVARIMLLDAPGGGLDPREFTRFRLAKGLPYPEVEAVVDRVPLRGDRSLGVAIRKAIVESYEALLTRAGLVQERIDLTPVAALLGLEGGRPKGDTAFVILGDGAATWAVSDQTGLRALRSRWRDPSPTEVGRLADELERTGLLLGGGLHVRRIRVVGPGARELIGGLVARGLPAEPGWVMPDLRTPEDPNELPWLGAALA
jgi:hypothetical protein